MGEQSVVQLVVIMQGIGGQALLQLVVAMQGIGAGGAAFGCGNARNERQAVVHLVVAMQGTGGRQWCSWLC